MATPFRPALQLLVQYARYHRDRRNIATHFVGVPMIVFGILVLLAGTGIEWHGLRITPAWLALALYALWALSRGELALGAVTTLGLALLALLAHRVAEASPAQWLGWSLGMFILGWVIQFIGHYYEGRKPAFADDLVGLVVAPLFVTLELLAPLGAFKPLMSEIERLAGPTVRRDLTQPAAR
jgi:uncharacterized membrane protein YGL010W